MVQRVKRIPPDHLRCIVGTGSGMRCTRSRWGLGSTCYQHRRVGLEHRQVGLEQRDREGLRMLLSQQWCGALHDSAP